MSKLPERALLIEALTHSIGAYSSPPVATSSKISDSFYSVTAFFTYGKDRDVLTFKGSQECRDWSLNVQAVPWRYNGRWCHAGFARAHNAVWPDLAELIRPDRELLITGHSLGGAMAELSAGFLSEHRAPIHLITFGKPNVFFMPQASHLHFLTSQFSVVSGSDLVARIPRFFFGPDPGQTILYLANNGIAYLNPERELKRGDWRLWNATSDHSLDMYRSRLDRILSDT